MIRMIEKNENFCDKCGLYVFTDDEILRKLCNNCAAPRWSIQIPHDECRFRSKSIMHWCDFHGVEESVECNYKNCPIRVEEK